MKLLKYVMTHDSGLAPNPYFGVCSLALCTPNHMRRKLCAGDWVVGHSSKATGNRLIYAMQLTRVIGMHEYFTEYPNKRPDPDGSIEQQHGDNMYFVKDGHWRRLPSAQHNCVQSFKQDKARQVYLAEGENRFWYFGASNSKPELSAFAQLFPWAVQIRQGCDYVRDTEQIQSFVHWLQSLGPGGVLGKPRDQERFVADRYLISTDPEEVWQDAATNEKNHDQAIPLCSRISTKSKVIRRTC